MGKRESKWLWRMKLVYWLLRYGYNRNPVAAWFYSGEECWIVFYEDYYTAHAAIYEDGTYGA